jgi:hypothetical protein
MIVLETELKYCKYGHIKKYRRKGSKYLECGKCASLSSIECKKKLRETNYEEYRRRKKAEHKKYYDTEKNRERKQMQYYLFVMEKQAIDFVIEPLVEEVYNVA